MSSDHEAEIRASVAAHQDLGSGYDDAVAEGLVERIGAEIDKRIEARLAAFGPVPAGSPGPQQAPDYRSPGDYAPAAPGAAGPPGSAGPAGPPGSAAAPGPGAPGYPGYQAPAGYQGYHGYQGYMGPMLPPGYQMGPPPAKPSSIGQRNVATTITALGSMALGVGATAIVSRGSNSGAQAVMVLLIWAAIAVINVAYARRH
jgi:hypothetical protein